MYEGDPYGDELDGADEDKNDGLNALVRKGLKKTFLCIEFAVGHRF